MHKPKFTDKYCKDSLEALEIALNTAPAYNTWRRFDPGTGASIDKRYAAMPVLTKKKIREYFPEGVVPDGRNLTDGLDNGDIELVQTSGTTAEKITNVWNQQWWNASESASWKLNTNTAHLDHSFREAQLASALSVGFRSNGNLPMQSRILNDRFLFLNEKISASEWTDNHYARIIRELDEFKPAVLEANPSLLARLAWWAIDNNAAIFQPQVILFTYEFPSALHLTAIKKVFRVPLASSYGSTEAGYVFMQCEHGIFHQNTDFCRVDFEPLKDIHGKPASGRILVTTFHNPWTSLIRFDIGDMVRLYEGASCPCGCNDGFMLEAIEGRTANCTFTTSGKVVTTRRLDEHLAKFDNLREYNLDQLTKNEFILKIMTKKTSKILLKEITTEMRSLYGKDASVTIEAVNDILPGPSGKYRRTCTHFDFNEKDLFA